MISKLLIFKVLLKTVDKSRILNGRDKRSIKVMKQLNTVIRVDLTDERLGC